MIAAIASITIILSLQRLVQSQHRNSGITNTWRAEKVPVDRIPNRSAIHWFDWLCNRFIDWPLGHECYVRFLSKYRRCADH